MDRRNILKLSLASVGGLLAARAVSASPSLEAPCSALGLTPAQAKGPFYPVVDQLDEDADLVNFAGQVAQPKGLVIFVEGVVTDQFCNPVPNALVEIWQACESGRYNHPRDPNPATLDPNFQYFGTSMTDQSGKYLFRTIIPGAYPADTDWIRPPHIHFKVAARGYEELITQMYFEGEALNQDDLILQNLPKQEQEKVVVMVKSEIGRPHPVAQFPIQLKKISRQILK